jgi:folate-dependent phosphoribosylglycinamide formyltransferase PurN
MYAHLAAFWPAVEVVAVRRGRASAGQRLSRACRKLRKLGLVSSLEITSSLWLRRALLRRDQAEVAERIRAIPRPDRRPLPGNVRWVSHANGADAVKTLEDLRPAILIQAGVGILRPCVFHIPALGTLNLHHGIAPLIRGMESIYWGLWERRPEWIGSTVHFIDAGIDTGRVLAYFRVEPIAKGEGFPSLFARATAGGVAELLQVVGRLLAGEPVAIKAAVGRSHYRSTFSGWKMLFLTRRLNRERRRTA